MLNVEPTKGNLSELGAVLRMKPDSWLEQFISLKGMQTLCDLLEVLEKT